MNDWNYLGQHTVDFAGTDILMSPPLVGMASVTFRPFASAPGSLNSAYLTWNGKYVGKQYFDNTSSADRSIPAYFVADLALGYSVPLKRSLDFARDDSWGVRDDNAKVRGDGNCHFDRPKGVEKSTYLTFSFHIHNLFNHRYYADAWLWRAYFRQENTFYDDIGIYPQAPLSAMFKVAWRF